MQFKSKYLLIFKFSNVFNSLNPILKFNGILGGAVLEDGDGIELVQKYDPRSNTWCELNSMLIPRSGSAACVLNGKIYIIGNAEYCFYSSRSMIL